MRIVGVMVAACGVAVCASGARGQALPGNVLVVRANAVPGGDGLTWATAFDDIYEALVAVQASWGVKNELWFTGGSYGRRTTQSPICGDVSVPLSIVGPLDMYGGFVGSEVVRSQRGAGGVGNVMGNRVTIDGVVSDLMSFSVFAATAPLCGDSGSLTIRDSTLCNASMLVGGKRGGTVRVTGSVIEDGSFAVSCGSSSATGSFVGSGSVFRRVGVSVPCGGISGGRYEGGVLNAGGGSIENVWMLRGRASANPPGGSAIANSTFIGSSVSAGRVISQSFGINSTYFLLPIGPCFSGGSLTNSLVDCRSFAPPGDAFVGTTLQWTTVNTRFVGFVTGPGVDSGSPIDTGNNDLVPPGLFTDIDGNPRFVGTATPAGGVGAAPRVDRGAVEALVPGSVVTTPAYCYANMDGSSALVGGTAVPTISPADFVAFLGLFRDGHPLANCDASTGSPTVDSADFACFLSKYRAGCS